MAKPGKKVEAREEYGAYLKIAPNGFFADRAKQALQKLEPASGR